MAKKLEWTVNQGTGPYGTTWDAEGTKYHYRVKSYRPSASNTGFSAEELDDDSQRQIEHSGSVDGAQKICELWENGWQ